MYPVLLASNDFSGIAEEYELMQYATAFLLLASAAVLTLGLMFISSLLRPNKPSAAKQMTYECGEEPVGSGWLRFNIRFYVVALVFVLFDVEMALVYPVACIFSDILNSSSPDALRAGLLVFGELFFFIAVLFLGLVYVWRKGDLGWIRSFRIPKEKGLRSWKNPSPSTIAPLSKR